MKSIKDMITADDQAKLQAAIEQAELNTVGEIIPVIAKQASHYHHANFIFGFLCSLLAFTGMWFFFQEQFSKQNSWANTSHMLGIGLPVILIVMIATFLLGALFAVYFPVVKMPFISKKEMQHEVERAAKSAFFHYSLGQQHTTSGVVIYVAIFERMIRIQGDVSISAVLNAEHWEQVHDVIINNFKNKQYVTGLSQGILLVGDFLAKHFPATSAEESKLTNTVYFED